ncbi:MAG: hypothetical protein ACI8ZM_003285 [Crocinitomix sp.]|jgi:hypothetical protein
MIQVLLLLCSLAIITPKTQNQTEKPCNCCTPKQQEFDFWIGSWEVYDTSGTRVGQNEIVQIQAGCALQEHWTGASGFTGTSLNYYDAKTEKWNQLWIDQSGSVLKLSGIFSGNQMTLISEEMYNQKLKKPYQNRIIWTLNEDGTVRQLWESTIDKGENWNTVFDGLYKKNI